MERMRRLGVANFGPKQGVPSTPRAAYVPSTPSINSRASTLTKVLRSNRGGIQELKASKSNKELLQLFSGCISALSNNKICSRNAFDVGLIDHLDELVHLRSSDEEMQDEDAISSSFRQDSAESKNNLCFTRASTAIEGATRVYGYRVEAIYDQTYKVLLSMADNKEADGDTEQPCDNRRNKRKIRQTEFRGGQDTLAPLEEITIDSLPLQNKILDPYFLKLSSMFDQSGAKGLLLTNLKVDSDLGLKFDGSGDALPHHTEDISDAPQTGKTMTINTDILKDFICKDENSSLEEVLDLPICPGLEYFKHKLEGIDEGKESAPPELQDIGKQNVGNTTATFADASLVDDFSNTDEQWLEQSSYRESESPDMESDFNVNAASTDLATIDHSSNQNANQNSWDNDTLSLDDRLAQIDMSGGTQFSYFRLDKNHFDGNIPSMVSVPKATDSRSKDEKQNQKAQKRSQLVDMDLVNFENLLIETPGFELLKHIKGTLKKRKCSNILVSEIWTCCPIEFQISNLISLSSVLNKKIRLHRVETKMENQFDCITDIEATLCDDESKSIFNSHLDDSNFKMLSEETKIYDENSKSNEMEEIDLFDNFNDIMTNDINQIWDTGEKSETQNLVLFDPMKNSQKLDSNELRYSKLSKYVDVSLVKNVMKEVIVPKTEKKPMLALMDDSTIPQCSDQKNFNDIITTTRKLLPDVERENCSVHMLFVCLLYACNDYDLALTRDPNSIESQAMDGSFNVAVSGNM